MKKIRELEAAFDAGEPLSEEELDTLADALIIEAEADDATYGAIVFAVDVADKHLN